MKKILIVKGEKAYLPEVYAYKEFLEKEKYQVKITSKPTMAEEKWADIIWRLMGIDLFNTKRKSKFLIHDYRSLSTTRLKDQIKKNLNKKPNLRIYLNDTVKEGMNFKDEVPYLLIDMGIAKEFCVPNKEHITKCYKFIYVGAINRFREIDKILEWFIKSEFKNEKFLLIGTPEKEIYQKYKKFSQIIFLGKIDYFDIPKYLSKAEYAFCNIPNRYPYNEQTPTKYLEYVATNLKILANRTKWIERFLESQKEQKTFLYDNLNEITKESLKKFEFNNINMENFVWENLLKKSKLLDVIRKGELK